MSVIPPEFMDTIRGYVTREPEDNMEEQDEYLDRLGVAEEEQAPEIDNQYIPYESIRGRQRLREFREELATEDESVVNARNAARQMDDARSLAIGSGMQSFQREYTNGYDAVTGAMERHDQNYRSQEIRHNRRMMRWANGDGETRPHRDMRWTQRYRDRDDVRVSEEGSFIHEQVMRANERIVESIMRDAQHLAYELIERQVPDRVVVSAVNHFLEDMGDNIYLRHRVEIRRREDTFSEWLEMELEMPDGLVRHMGFQLDRNREEREGLSRRW